MVRRQVAESGSVLKKRTKKLLQIRARSCRIDRTRNNQQFLLIFFRKEDLPALHPIALPILRGTRNPRHHEETSLLCLPLKQQFPRIHDAIRI
jgi:hypothetical protein